ACPGNRTSVTVRQERFGLGGTDGAGGAGQAGEAGGSSGSRGSGGGREATRSSESGAPWQGPGCLKAAGRTNATCEDLNDASRTSQLEGTCASWAFANAGAQGY